MLGGPVRRRAEGSARHWQAAHCRAAAHSPTGIGKPPTLPGRRYLKKGLGLLCPRSEVIYELVHQLQKEAIPVKHSCRLLSVRRSAYYEARRCSTKPVLCKASVHLKAAFAASGQSYGSCRLVSVMANQGFQIGRYKVRRLMRQAVLKPVWKRKFVHTTDSNHDLPVAANVLNRQFNPPAPNMAYVSDITYIRTGAGWLYLAVVLDLFARKVVAGPWRQACPTNWFVRLSTWLSSSVNQGQV